MHFHSVSRSLALAVALATGATACARRPAHFADAAPVVRAADDAPIAAPRPLDPLDAVYMTEAYLRRPLVEALEPERVADAKDVNALDEVPRSSWFRPVELGAPPEPVEAPTHGAPVLPLSASAPDLVDDALAVRDARGLAYLLVRDPPDRPEMATGASIVASRLLRALGWLTAETTLLEIARKDIVAVAPPPDASSKKIAPTRPPETAIAAFFHPPKGPAADRLRVAAIEWPVGLDLGPTPMLGTRKDDANDTLEHTDRRTLRALGTVGSWLRLRRFGAWTLRDAYVGVEGRGHVVHMLVRLEAALGAGSIVRPQDPNDNDPEDFDSVLDFFTLGLAAPRRAPTQTTLPALGDLDESLREQDARPSPPLDAVDRVRPPDAYWAAKRIAELPESVIGAALDAGKFSDARVRTELWRLLIMRRALVFARAAAEVTACEVEGVDKGRVVLRDEALRHGAANPATTRYVVSLLDAEGRALASPVGARAINSRFAVDLGPALRAGAPYVIVAVVAVRDGRAAPRRFEAHFVAGASGPRLVGVRH